jgi:hypothetical protein
MSLVLNTLPDPQSQIASLQRALQEKTQRIAELEQELLRERNKNRGMESGAEQLRTILRPLYNALGMIYGQIEDMGISSNGAAPVSGEDERVWTSWKQKLGGKTGEAIDVLRMHGAMTYTQLRLQLHCATRTVTNIVGALHRAGLITKADGKITLRELK